MAKRFRSRVAQRIASRCIDLFGGYGFTREHPVEKFLPRRQDRHDLRRHQQNAAPDHREEPDEVIPNPAKEWASRGDAEVAENNGRINSLQFSAPSAPSALSA